MNPNNTSTTTRLGQCNQICKSFNHVLESWESASSSWCMNMELWCTQFRKAILWKCPDVTDCKSRSTSFKSRTHEFHIEFKWRRAGLSKTWCRGLLFKRDMALHFRGSWLEMCILLQKEKTAVYPQLHSLFMKHCVLCTGSSQGEEKLPGSEYSSVIIEIKACYYTKENCAKGSTSRRVPVNLLLSGNKGGNNLTKHAIYRCLSGDHLCRFLWSIKVSEWEIFSICTRSWQQWLRKSIFRLCAATFLQWVSASTLVTWQRDVQCLRFLHCISLHSVSCILYSFLLSYGNHRLQNWPWLWDDFNPLVVSLHSHFTIRLLVCKSEFSLIWSFSVCAKWKSKEKWGEKCV